MQYRGFLEKLVATHLIASTGNFKKLAGFVFQLHWQTACSAVYLLGCLKICYVVQTLVIEQTIYSLL